MAPFPRPPAASEGQVQGPLRGSLGTRVGRLRPRRLLFHLHRAPLEAWVRSNCPRKGNRAPSAPAPRESRAAPPPPSRRILTGERPRAGATREGAPAAGGCSPGGPRGSGRERDTGARRRPRKAAPAPPGRRDRYPQPGPGVPAPHPAAVPVPPTARGASVRPSRSCGLSLCPALRSRRALAARHKLAAESGRPRLEPRARALLLRFPANSFLLRPAAKPFHAPEQREGNQRRRPAAAALQPERRRRPEVPLAGKETFSPPPCVSAQSPRRGGVGRRGLRSCRASIGRPGPVAPSPRDNNRAPDRGGSAGESGAEIVGNSELYFPASLASSLHYVLGNIYQMQLKRKRECANN